MIGWDGGRWSAVANCKGRSWNKKEKRTASRLYTASDLTYCVWISKLICHITPSSQVPILPHELCLCSFSFFFFFFCTCPPVFPLPSFCFCLIVLQLCVSRSFSGWSSSYLTLSVPVSSLLSGSSLLFCLSCLTEQLWSDLTYEHLHLHQHHAFESSLRVYPSLINGMRL